jgi:ElaB/YqjD/DUF883 family membrane-anchored ribosome-binding protein
MADLTKDEMRERLGNIDRIRDILFGVQLREYNGRFNQIEAHLSTQQQEIRDRIDDVRTTLTTELRAISDSLEKKLKTLSLSTQEEGTELRHSIDHLNRKFSSNIEALNEMLDEQKTSVREEICQTRDRLQEDVQSLRTHVFQELNGRFSTLKEIKVSRNDMAEMLFEFGMRLKGTEVVPQLREAGETDALANLLLPDQPERPEHFEG